MSPVVQRGWAVVAAASGTVLIGAGAFWLSFTALADLAVRSGIPSGQAWIWPLLVDGLIVVATVAVVALDGPGQAWYPWSLLIAGALVSVAANAAHALIAAEAAVPGVLAAIIASVPPLVLLASTHLTVVLIRSTHPVSPTHQPEPEPVSAPVEASEDDETDGVSATADEPPASHPLSGEPAPEPPLPPVPGPAASGRSESPAQSERPEPGVDRRAEAQRMRRELRWSNKQIAKALDVHPSTVGRWLPRPDPTPEQPTETESADADGDGPGPPTSTSDVTEEHEVKEGIRS